MPAPSISKSEVILRLLDVFRQHGYEGASLTRLSEATGLGKSSLYHYFPGGKEDMAKAVLDHVRGDLEARPERLREAGPPPRQIDAMLTEMDLFYRGGRAACVLGALVASGGRSVAQEELRRNFRSWIDGLTETLTEAGIAEPEARRRAEDAVLRIQGALILSCGLDDPAPFARTLGELRESLLST